jgi:uncharacterized protein
MAIGENVLDQSGTRESTSKREQTAQPYWSPYAAGIGLGLVLLAAYVIMGRGIGASGAFTSLIAGGLNAIAPVHTQQNSFYKEYIGDGSVSPFLDWIVIEVLGVFAGGALSGVLAGRLRKTVERGPRISVSRRFAFAFLGGGVMGFGSKLARGCTSGQALTGGALLSVGSWAFMIAVFIGGYAVAQLFRRQWT